MGFRIVGTGSALPSKVITNYDLEKILDTNDEWIRTRTGIVGRHVLGDDESLVSLGTESVKKALDQSGILSDEIDLLVCTSLQGDFVSPSMSCIIGGNIGVRDDCITLDINMGCCGFIYGLHVVSSYIKSGMAKCAVVVSAESLSRLVDWTDRANCILCGDGAGAVVLKADENSPEAVFDFKLKPNSEYLKVERGTDNCPYNTCESVRALKMNGQEIYKFAVSSVPERINALLDKTGYSHDDIAKYFLHQANLRIINSAIHRFGVGEEKFPRNIDKTGNTSSATIPVLLDEVNRAGEIAAGDKIVLCAFGAGLASSACIIEW